jgi:class 3 adenylate cyclase
MPRTAPVDTAPVACPAGPVDLRTVLITDIVSSTTKQALLGDCGWRDVLRAHHRVVRAALERWQGYENDTAGDGVYATFIDPTDAVWCALEIADGVRPLGLDVRAGVHRGTCELVDDKCAGLTVSIGARVAALAGGSEVLVTDAVYAAARRDGLRFEGRGSHLLNGVPGRWRLYRALIPEWR